VQAGLRIIGDASADEVLGFMSVAQICAEAGCTRGSFHHHFPDWESFVRALIVYMSDHGFTGFDEQLVTAVADVPIENLIEVVGSGARAAWRDAHKNEGFLAPKTLLFLFLLGGRPLGGNEGEVKRIFQERYWNELRTKLGGLYSALLQAAEREVVPPLSAEDLAEQLAALEFGYRLLDSCGVSVSEDEFADRMVIWTSVLTRQIGHSTDFSTVASTLMKADGHLLVDSVSEARWQRVSGLFDRPGDVPMGDIATALGETLSTTVRIVATPRRAAALSCRPMVSKLRDEVARRVDRGTGVAVADGLCELGRWARKHPRQAASMLGERLALAAAAPAAAGDIKALVPIDNVFVPYVGSSKTAVRSIGTAVDITLHLAITRQDISPGDVAGRSLAAAGL
jgi:AcrR family transcriptional regulator